MPSAAPPYHHGNLRAALLEAAAAEIASVGPAALSLRELARRAGVSHAAPAHHFGDKRGLFTALAAEGFRLLHQRTTPALEAPGALMATGQRYVEFALDHPSHFAVMFDQSLLAANDEELVREKTVAFEVLFEAVRRGTRVASDDELAAQALTAWAIVHGLATLWLAGNLPYPVDSRQVGAVFGELGPALVPVARVAVDQLYDAGRSRRRPRLGRR